MVRCAAALSSEFLEAGGNFWLRARVQRYLWQPNRPRKAALNRNAVIRDIEHLKSTGGAYIGLHIRLTDNVDTIRRDFMFEPKRMFALDNFLKIARQIRSVHSNVSTLFVATDSRDVEEEVTRRAPAEGWRLIIQPHSQAQRVTGHEWLWFKKPNAGQAVDGVIADVEFLRRADFLVGSMISNVFRLAAELNYASRTRAPKWRTIHTLDLPWYQHP